MILVLVETPEDFRERVGRIVPEEEIVFAHADGAEAVLPKARIVFGHPPVKALAGASELRWLHLPSAGADRYVGELPEGVVLTNATGVYGVPAAEHVFSLMLALARRIPDSVRRMGQARWDRSDEYDELFGRTCGILGFGDIGMAVARRARAFGMRVLALRRNPVHAPDLAERVYGPDDLLEMLSQCDHVVNALPSTAATHQFIDAEALRAMKPDARFYNVGRGSTVNEQALIEALSSGRLAGAGLDVLEEEPLPPYSPLWAMGHVIITPHVGGLSPREAERGAELFFRNLTHWAEGEDLENIVDSELGY